MPDLLRIAYLGNFQPGVPAEHAHSTENHVARALANNGHQVHRFQENEPEAWRFVIDNATRASFDLILWTRTGWNWPDVAGISLETAHALQWQLLQKAAAARVPTVGFHLDRWWGLSRSPQVEAEPFFQVELLVTADGGHDQQWAEVGVTHHWMPPGVSRDECERTGTVRPDLRAQVGFVGSWRSYHREWLYRRQLVRQLQAWYGQPVRPRPPYERLRVVEGGMRGQDLADLYASIDVLVGDSCLAPAVGGAAIARYWSDRIPETLGRGGFLIHPDVPGLRDQFPEGTLVTYPLGDMEELHAKIEFYLAADEVRRAHADAGRQHVLDHHTYEVRMHQLVGHLNDQGML